MHTNFGNIAIEECNDMNIPICCDLEERDDGKWEWNAANYMPRKASISQSQYQVIADTKEEIIELVKKYVVPLYQTAIDLLTLKGELYYWEIR